MLHRRDGYKTYHSQAVQTGQGMCLMNSRVCYLENRQYYLVISTQSPMQSTPKTLPPLWASRCAHRKVDFKSELRHLAHLPRMLEAEIRETPQLEPEVNQDCVKDRQILDHRTKKHRRERTHSARHS